MENFTVLTKYFIDNFFHLIIEEKPSKDWREERAKFYFEKLMELHSVIEKVEKYELYFSDFYPESEKIHKAEAIEYHWHSYIHDLFILRERLIKIIGSLKNDLPRYGVGNLVEMKRALEHLKMQSIKGLEKAHDARTTISHDFTLRNLSLTKAKALQILKSQNKGVDLNLQSLEEKYVILTESIKKKYIVMASRNKAEIQKMKDFFAPRFGIIFASLNGHDTSIFKIN